MPRYIEKGKESYDTCVRCQGWSWTVAGYQCYCAKVQPDGKCGPKPSGPDDPGTTTDKCADKTHANACTAVDDKGESKCYWNPVSSTCSNTKQQYTCAAFKSSSTLCANNKNSDDQQCYWNQGACSSTKPQPVTTPKTCEDIKNPDQNACEQNSYHLTCYWVSDACTSTPSAPAPTCDKLEQLNQSECDKCSTDASPTHWDTEANQCASGNAPDPHSGGGGDGKCSSYLSQSACDGKWLADGSACVWATTSGKDTCHTVKKEDCNESSSKMRYIGKEQCDLCKPWNWLSSGAQCYCKAGKMGPVTCEADSQTNGRVASVGDAL